MPKKDGNKRTRNSSPGSSEVYRNEEIDQHLELVADRVREVYIQERRSVEKMRTGMRSTYVPGPHWDGDARRNRKPIWPRIATFLLNNKVEPEMYVRQVFRLAKSAAKTLMPNQLCSTELLKLYREWQPSYGKLIWQAFMTQQHIVKAQLAYCAEYGFSKAETWAMVLLDEQVPMTALFRYCLAKSEGLEHIADRYEQSAVMEYLSSPDNYDKYWGEWIPQTLKDSASAASQYISRREGDDDAKEA